MTSEKAVAASEARMEQREAAWKRYRSTLEPSDNKTLAREAFNEAWFSAASVFTLHDGERDRMEKTIETLKQRSEDYRAKIDGLHAGLKAALNAAKLGLFVIRKQGVMPNSSWEGGFEDDVAKGEAALLLIAEHEETK